MLRSEENRLENERVWSASKNLMSVYEWNIQRTGEYLLQISYRHQDLNNSQIYIIAIYNIYIYIYNSHNSHNNKNNSQISVGIQCCMLRASCPLTVAYYA